MAQKKLTDFIPEKETETHLVQAKIGKKLADAVNIQRNKGKRKLSWTELVEASLRRYLEEEKDSK